jgi:ATP-dependent Clp protease protease subunit
MRMALPHAQIHLHQPWIQGMQGQASDIEIHAREMLKQRETMIRVYAKHCGREIEEIERDVERDFFMSAEQARDYGLIDAIVDRSPVRQTA